MKKAPRIGFSWVVRLGLLSCLATGLGGANPLEAAAQITTADSAAVLLRTAADFERQGRWDVAEALYRLIAAEYAGTPAAAEARARLAAPTSERAERISGAELPVFGTLYGLWLGVAVPQAFGSTSSEAYGAGLLLGGPIGLLTSRAALRARPMTEGQVRAISWAAYGVRGRVVGGPPRSTSAQRRSAGSSGASRAGTAKRRSSPPWSSAGWRASPRAL